MKRMAALLAVTGAMASVGTPAAMAATTSSGGGGGTCLGSLLLLRFC
jgi:hypothetical protein